MKIDNKIKKEKRCGFSVAYGNLMYKDAIIVQQVIMGRCNWLRMTFYQKKDGDRLCSDYSEKKINEIAVVESVFQAFNLDAWTGEVLQTKHQTATAE